MIGFKVRDPTYSIKRSLINPRWPRRLDIRGARPSRALAKASQFRGFSEDCFGQTPKPTPVTGVLPGVGSSHTRSLCCRALKS